MYFLKWAASPKNALIKVGADLYVVRNGLVVAQTIQYTVLQKGPEDWLYHKLAGKIKYERNSGNLLDHLPQLGTSAGERAFVVLSK